MTEQGFPAQHTTTTSTSTSVVTTIRFDPSYIRSVPGILKIVQIVLNFLGFICIQVSGFSHHSRGSWFITVSTFGFWFTGLLLVLYLFHVVEKFYKIPWLRIEFGYCILWTFFYLLAASLAAAFGDEAFAAASFFGFCAMIVYGYDAFLKYQSVRAGRLEQGVKVVSKETTSPAETQAY